MGSREDRIDQGTIEGHDPTQEVGPEECEAKAADTSVAAGALEEQADGSHPKFMEEIQEAYQPEQDFMVPHPADGLPTPADERDSDNLATAPAFTYENVICVGDDREWVELFESEIDFLKEIPIAADLEPGSAAGVLGPLPPGSSDSVFARWWVAIVAPDGSEYRLAANTFELRGSYGSDGAPQSRRVFEAENVFQVFGRWAARGHRVATSSRTHPGDEVQQRLVFVRPRREPCRFYQRQIFSNDAVPDPNEPGHKIVFRNCTARRSVGGAYLSLRDEAVYACDYRDPPDPESTKLHLDDPDRQKLRGDDHLHRLPLFKTVSTTDPAPKE